MLSTQQISRINDALYRIHADLCGDLGAAALARVAAYSEQHFHRLFVQVVGEPVHHYVRRVRLEQAANQMMFDSNSPLALIAGKCGFASVSSFSRAFKASFEMTPGQWRAVDQSNRTPPYLGDTEIAAAYARIRDQALPSPQLLELPPRLVAYVRHSGYGRGIRSAWQTLQAWAQAQNIEFTQQYGLHHSNPAWVELEQCRYVACLGIDKPALHRSAVNTLTIPGGLHAVFRLDGKYGELLPQLSKILAQWLPASGFKMQTTPAYVHYLKNHFLAADERFDLEFCLPISIV